MEQITGEVNSHLNRVTHIDFLKNKFIIFFLLIVSCTSNQTTTIKEYSNFIYSRKKVDKIEIITSKIDTDYKSVINFTYNIIIDNNNALESIVNSNFEFNNKKVELPNSFRNSKNSKYEYSIMPSYSDNKSFVAKSFEFRNENNVLILKGENPYCNGSNCTSYYVHLIIFKDSNIISNFVYLFDYQHNNFDDMTIVLESNDLLFSEKEKIIDKLVI